MKNMEILEKIAGAPDWGTIGPEFVRANKVLAEHFGAAYGLIVFSATAGLEAILRGWNVGYGDEVLIGDYSDPADTMVTAAVGATPVFADISLETRSLTPEDLEKKRTEKTRAVIVDFPAGKICGIRELKSYCEEKNLKLILNLDGAGAEGEFPVQYADAAFLDLSCAAGLAGLVLTDVQENFDLFYAYHNCGRPFGEGCTLSFENIIGGDLRVAEWQAGILAERIGELDEILKRQAAEKIYEVMHDQPFLQEEYFRKLTGSTIRYEEGTYPNSEKMK